jgi:hypothetical protein
MSGKKSSLGLKIVHVHDEDEVSSHARALPKNLIASVSYRITRKK